MPGGREPTVSVCMITYNHSAMVEQAVRGVLEQDTPFVVELVVGDDGSTDGTRELLRQLAARHPGRIRLLLSDNNRGMMANFMATLEACHAPYVALCEGDDYWIDNSKLARQVALLESHPDAAVSFHNAWIEDPDGRRLPFHTVPLAQNHHCGEDLLRCWLMPTASVLFRRPEAWAFPPFFSSATHGDLALFLLLAECGSLIYQDEVMSVYRRHAGGITTSFQGIDFNRREITFLEAMDAHFGGKYRPLLSKRIAALHRSSAVHMLAEGGRRREAWGELRRSWRARVGVDQRVAKESLQILFGLAAPRLYRRLRALGWKRHAD